MKKKTLTKEDIKKLSLKFFGNEKALRDQANRWDASEREQQLHELTELSLTFFGNDNKLANLAKLWQDYEDSKLSRKEKSSIVNIYISSLFRINQNYLHKKGIILHSSVTLQMVIDTFIIAQMTLGTIFIAHDIFKKIALRDIMDIFSNYDFSDKRLSSHSDSIHDDQTSCQMVINKLPNNDAAKPICCGEKRKFTDDLAMSSLDSSKKRMRMSSDFSYVSSLLWLVSLFIIASKLDDDKTMNNYDLAYIVVTALDKYKNHDLEGYKVFMGQEPANKKMTISEVLQQINSYEISIFNKYFNGMTKHSGDKGYTNLSQRLLLAYTKLSSFFPKMTISVSNKSIEL